MENRKVLKSGEFLVSEVTPQDIFIPEEYDEEQKMIAQTCKDFLESEIVKFPSNVVCTFWYTPFASSPAIMDFTSSASSSPTTLSLIL